MRRLLVAITAACIAAGGLSACTSSGAEGGDRDAGSKSPCLQPDEVREIATLPIISKQPSGTRLTDSFESCDISGPAFAERVYETRMKGGEVAEFYRSSAKADGWLITRADSLPYPDRQVDFDDFFCAGKTWIDGPLYLEIQWPDADSETLKGREEGTVFELTLGRQPRASAACPSPAMIADK
ncbi:hypothetical protein [Actinoplanes rectilineatus]|uniref:hypothetical protein n=1 Tax=Actinoplanes rectilineatus TaxID=113571 RepID=UPI000AF5DB62|nr:hypothetical protein [Actinoplanes rectilineatus]